MVMSDNFGVDRRDMFNSLIVDILSILIQQFLPRSRYVWLLNNFLAIYLIEHIIIINLTQ